MCWKAEKCNVSVRRNGICTIQVLHAKETALLSQACVLHIWAPSPPLCWFEWHSANTLVVFMAQVGHSSPPLACLWLPAWRSSHFLIVIVWFVIFCWCRCGDVFACVWWSGRAWTIGAETEASQHVRSLSPRHRMDSYSPPTNRGKYALPTPSPTPVSLATTAERARTRHPSTQTWIGIKHYQWVCMQKTCTYIYSIRIKYMCKWSHSYMNRWI